MSALPPGVAVVVLGPSGAALAADPERQYRRMKHQRVAIGRHRAIGDDDAEIGALSPSR